MGFPSLFGFELFLNQVHGPIRDRAGHGRVFLGLEDDQAAALVPHIRERGIHASRDEWGRPALLLLDPDGNQPYFWVTDRAWERIDLVICQRALLS